MEKDGIPSFCKTCPARLANAGRCDSKSYGEMRRLVELCQKRGEVWHWGGGTALADVSCPEIIQHILENSKVITKGKYLAMRL